MNTCRASIPLSLLFLTTLSALAQNQDCRCPGEWVQRYDGRELVWTEGPNLVHSHTSMNCQVVQVPTHTHTFMKHDYCREIGGSCASLNWIAALQTLYDNTASVTVTVLEYEVPRGFEAREERFKEVRSRLQSFECIENGIVLKTLSRSLWRDENIRIQIRMFIIEDCRDIGPVEPPPGVEGLLNCQTRTR